MFCRNSHKSLFSSVLAIFVFTAIYSMYGISDVFAATASMTTTGSVSIDVSASGNSANIGSDTLIVNTTCSTGYTVTISSSISDAALYKDGDSTSNSKINPSAGTLASPLPIIGDDGNGTSYLGTWGYSMTSSAVNGTFTGLNSTPTIIKQSSIASGDGSGDPTTGIDTIPVYYGVSVTPQLETGSYTMAKDNNNNPGTIVYQLTMPIACEPYTVEFNGNGGATANNETTYTQIIHPDIPTNLTANAFIPANSKEGFIEWNTDPDGNGVSYTNGESVTNLATGGGSITLYAIWDCPPNKICYVSNGATSSTETGNESATAGVEVSLFAPNFYKTGYGFAAWNTEPDGTGTDYGPNEFITPSADIAVRGLWLYARWVESEGNIQNWNGCSSLAVGSVTALTDTRDNNTYAVAKLEDGKCWTIENLRLASTDVLTSSNTYNPATNFKLLEPTTEWCIQENATCYNLANMSTVNIASPVSESTNFNQNIYSYGVYYKWNAATAGRGVWNTSANSVVAGSICPAGWRAPTSVRTANNSRDYYALLNKLVGGGKIQYPGDAGFKASVRYPNNFVVSGSWFLNSADRRGAAIASHSSTAGSSNYSSLTYYSTIDSSDIALLANKFNGFTLRCVKN